MNTQKKQNKQKEKKISPLNQVQKNQIMQMVVGQAERKFFDVASANAISFSGSVFPLSDIPQGDSDQTRDGDQIMPKSLEIGFQAFCADSSNTVRVVVFRWKPFFSFHNPLASDILQSTGTSTGYLSPLNHDKRKQFDLLYDHTVQMVLTMSNSVVSWSRKIKLSAIKCQWNTGQTTDVSNGFYVMAISDSAAIAHPQLQFYSRVNYTDS
jgi:hypothetical protein